MTIFFSASSKVYRYLQSDAVWLVLVCRDRKLVMDLGNRDVDEY